MAQPGKCLPCKHEDVWSMPQNSLKKAGHDDLSMLTWACDFSAEETRIRASLELTGLSNVSLAESICQSS